MVKLDASLLRYLNADEQRVLIAVEMGMKNHEIVPTPLICSISNMKRSYCHAALKNLHRHKLLHHEGKAYDGYKLNYSGYDYLSLITFSKRDTVVSVGRQIGVGKESDIFVVQGPDEEALCLKLHRLGRTSFRTIKNKRDYLKHRKNASWLYMSRLAAMKEFAFMKVLYEHGFPVPTPIDNSRHAVVMSLVKGYPMSNVARIRHPAIVYSKLMNLIIKLVRHGLIHCDFNEFNVMISDEEEITMIDFPQMVSTNHPNAEWYFDRDVQCVRTYFSRKYRFDSAEYPKFGDYVDQKEKSLDREVEASGHFTKQQQHELEKMIADQEKREEERRKHNGEEEEDEEEADVAEVEEDEVEVGAVEEADDESDEESEESVELKVGKEEEEEDSDDPEAEVSFEEPAADEEADDGGDVGAAELERIKREILSRNREENELGAETQGGEEVAVPVAVEAEEAAVPTTEPAKKKKKRKKKSAAEVSDDIIRAKVKRNLARRTKEKKRNTNKGAKTKILREVKHDAREW